MAWPHDNLLVNNVVHGAPESPNFISAMTASLSTLNSTILVINMRLDNLASRMFGVSPPSEGSPIVKEKQGGEIEGLQKQIDQLRATALRIDEIIYHLEKL